MDESNWVCVDPPNPTVGGGGPPPPQCGKEQILWSGGKCVPKNCAPGTERNEKGDCIQKAVCSKAPIITRDKKPPNYYPIDRALTLEEVEKKFKFPDGHAGYTEVYLAVKSDQTECVTEVILTTTTTLPNWKDRNKACTAVKDEWDRFMRDTNTHEEGHVKIGEEYYEGVENDFIGKTINEARNIIDEKREDFKENFIKDYDSQTDHGAKQGAELDTLIKCSQKPKDFKGPLAP